MDEPKPTSSETSRAQRAQMVTLHAQGWSYDAIAADLGCSKWTVGRWVRAHQRGGDDALRYHSRRPQTPHPLTTPVLVQERIRAIHAVHPGWGARLIRRQLDLDGMTPLPSETTIHAWLRRWDCPLVRPLRHKPLGFGQPVKGATPCWEVDFKEKRGIST
jgi:transposase-like protein